MDDMSRQMGQDLLALVPEGILAGVAVLGLLLGSFLPRHQQWLIRLLGGIGAAAAVVTSLLVWGREPVTVFGGSYGIDTATNTIRVVAAVSVLLILVLSIPETRCHARESESVVLFLLAGLGAVLLAGANDLMLLVAAYLLASIPLYALVGFAKDASGSEATLKYYLLGALFGTTMLFGVTIVFGIGGATAYGPLTESLGTAPRVALALGAVSVLGGLLFKAGAVPAHFWVPDVTEGTRPAVAAFVTTVPKLGAVVAIYRFSATLLEPTGVDWSLLVAIIATATMTLGNLAAFLQNNVRRLLAYSTISQVGYLLVGVAAAGRSDLALPSVLLYLAAYAVTNLGAFAVVCALPGRQSLSDYTGLIRRSPALLIALVVCLLGLIGTPPTGVFAGKLTVFTAAFDAGLGWLVIVAAINTVASVYYYLRWIVPAVRGSSGPPEVMPAAPRAIAYLAALISIVVGVLSGPILDVFDGALAVR